MANSLRLDKLLADAGYGSRKDIKKIVRSGTVTVNGQPVNDSSIHVSPEQDIIMVGSSQVIYKEFVYLMLNKPAGCISATEDMRAPTVLELVPPQYAHYDLFPVGRLDKDTEGLLILTNDGQLTHNLLAPKKHVAKTYYARIKGKVSEKHIDYFKDGVVLDDGYKTMPAELKILNSGEISEIELTIHEGKYHQVKRMFEAHDMSVIYLKRISMGGVNLDNSLNPGEARELSEEELVILKEANK